MNKDIYNHEYFKEIKPHIIENFIRFNEENPTVLNLVKKFAYEAKNSGRKRFGIQMIIERIRWYCNIETTGDKFKISNNHASCYARFLMVEDDFFYHAFSRKITNVKNGKQ